VPLLPGKKNIGKNIATEIAHGKPRKQAIAIALSVARRRGNGGHEHVGRRLSKKSKSMG
jgi:hypothetical protein